MTKNNPIRGRFRRVGRGVDKTLVQQHVTGISYLLSFCQILILCICKYLTRTTSEKHKMKTIPYRCDDSKHKALLGAARSTGTSVQRLFDNFVTHVITERQAEARFVVRQKRGNPARGRKLLAEIRQRIASHAK